MEVGSETQSIGVMVDSVNAVLEIPAAEIEPAQKFGANIHTDFIAGMGKIDGKFVIILNIQYVLSMDGRLWLLCVQVLRLSYRQNKHNVGAKLIKKYFCF